MDWSRSVKKFISLVIEPEVLLAFPGLRLHLEKDCSCVFAFLFPSDLSCASFPIPSDVSRIGSLL
jgi:hypothetical protein